MGLLGAGPGPAPPQLFLWPDLASPGGLICLFSPFPQANLSLFSRVPVSSLPPSCLSPQALFLPCLRPVSHTRFRSLLETAGTTIFGEFPSLKGFLGLMEISLDCRPYKEEDRTWPGAEVGNPAGNKHSDTKDQYLGLLNSLS